MARNYAFDMCRSEFFYEDANEIRKALANGECGDDEGRRHNDEEGTGLQIGVCLEESQTKIFTFAIHYFHKVLCLHSCEECSMRNMILLSL